AIEPRWGRTRDSFLSHAAGGRRSLSDARGGSAHFAHRYDVLRTAAHVRRPGPLLPEQDGAGGVPHADRYRSAGDVCRCDTAADVQRHFPRPENAHAWRLSDLAGMADTKPH